MSRVAVDVDVARLSALPADALRLLWSRHVRTVGGTPPLGYAPEGRSLSIVPDHAKLIRHIYARYLDIGNVRLLANELAQVGIGLPIQIILAGSAPASLTAKRLTQPGAIAICWHEQRRTLGIASRC